MRDKVVSALVAILAALVCVSIVIGFAFKASFWLGVFVTALITLGIAMYVAGEA
jgi:hypothetical protein